MNYNYTKNPKHSCMKKTIITTIIIIVLLLILGIYIVVNCIPKIPVDYRIDDVRMERIEFSDGLFSDNRFYRLSFDVTPVNYKRKLFGNEYAIIGGCVDSVIDIYILSDTQERLNEQFGQVCMCKGDSLDRMEFVHNDFSVYYYNMDDIRDLLQDGHDPTSINSRHVGVNFGYAPSFIISMSQDALLPHDIVIKCNNREIKRPIINTSSKRYEIKSMDYRDSSQFENKLWNNSAIYDYWQKAKNVY